MNRRRKLASQNVKRSVVVGGHKTSIGLEAPFCRTAMTIKQKASPT
jgi:predicted DNA-binding ribbon-helix-helix protein